MNQQKRKNDNRMVIEIFECDGSIANLSGTDTLQISLDTNEATVPY